MKGHEVHENERNFHNSVLFWNFPEINEALFDKISEAINKEFHLKFFGIPDRINFFKKNQHSAFV